MLTVRKNRERGHALHDWLESYHTFSFAEYWDPQHMGVSHLCVINEDRVQPGQGFPTHGHRDMEIISYVLEGALEHKDSMGQGAVIRPGDLQRMSAGTGVTHSEYNASDTEAAHFLQIWIRPNQQGLRPSYEHKTFANEHKRARLRLVGSPDGRNGSLSIHQDVFVYSSLLIAGEFVAHRLADDRVAYVHLARGTAKLNGESLSAGDGAMIREEDRLRLEGINDAEVLLFDLALEQPLA